jgi:hypothetical protein
MFGLAFLVTYFTGECRDPGMVWPGTFGVLIGSFFFLFTFGALDWNRMGDVWGVFPAIVGLSFLATWVAKGGREPGLLVPALIPLLVGTIGLGLELGLLDARMLDLLWPLALVLLGALMIARSLRRTQASAGDLSAESPRRDE